MKKLSYLIVLIVILGLVLTGCLLSNVGQVPTTEQSGITYLTKGLLTTGLVGLWSFDEGIGNKACDSSGYGNDGIITGATYVGSVNAVFDDALSFDGTDDYVDCGDISTANWENLTTEAWVYWDGTVRQGYAGVYSKAYGSDIGRLIINGAGTILVQNGNGNFFSDSINDVPVNQWCHIAYVYDQGAGKEYIYVNGAKKGEQDRTGNITKNSYTFCIGYGWMGPDYYIFSGHIDEVRVWNTALSPERIVDHAAGIYGFNGLMAPYATPEEKKFKAGRTIPLKWQYTNFDGNVVDSFDAYPVVEFQFAGAGSGDGILELTEDPGESGLRYDSDAKTWQFNWQTKDLIEGIGTYNIWITSEQTGQVNGPFQIELR